MEKIITTKEVRKILRSVWPNLQHIWIFDSKLILLDLDAAKEILKDINVYENQFKDELFDCDDYALVCNAFVKLKVASMKLSHNWAFGEATMLHPIMGIHNQNVFITDDLKVKLYEPQAAQITESGQGEATFYVRM